MKQLIIYSAAVCLFLGACEVKKVDEVSPADATDRNNAIATNSTGLLLKDANPDVIVGAAINSYKFGNSSYLNLVKQQYNSVTAENDMKIASLHPSETTWDFGNPNNSTEEKNEKIPNLAKNFGAKRIHGHTLVWHKSLPDWIKNIETNTPVGQRAARLDTIMKRHIFKTVAFYSNNYKAGNPLLPLLKSWDVVNEAFYNSGTLRGTKNMVDGDDTGSIWKRYMDEIYIEKAFRYARQAARANQNWKLKLFYNDYGHEFSPAKLTAICNMVNALKLKKEGPDPIINGVGLQMHINVGTDPAAIRNAITKVKETGLLVHIAELDISLFLDKETSIPAGKLAERKNAQKKLYGDIAKWYQEIVPVKQRWGITLWNVGDSDSSQPTAHEPTLYDVNYFRKANFYYFRDSLALKLNNR